MDEQIPEEEGGFFGSDYPHEGDAEKISSGASVLQAIGEDYRRTKRGDMTPHQRQALNKAAELIEEAIGVLDETFRLEDDE